MTGGTVIGCFGTVIVATRGEAGMGEVSLRMLGATDSYLAWSREPLPRGTPVVVTDTRGPRTVEVEAIDDLTSPAGEPPDLLQL